MYSFYHVALFFLSFEDKFSVVSMINFYRQARFLSFAVPVLDLWFLSVKISTCMSIVALGYVKEDSAYAVSLK